MIGSVRGIDRNRVVPFYFQLKEILISDIASNWSIGAKLPSESELGAQYGVSRTVVRQALDEIERQGLIYKVKGKGAFITGRKLEASHVQELAGFHASMTGQGHTVSSRVLRQEVVSATPQLARLLSLDVGDPVIALDRVRSVDQVAISVVRAALPHRLCPGLEEVDLRNVSLYATLAQRHGLRPSGGRRTIEAVPVSAVDAAHLGVRAGSPALLVESVVRGSDGVPFETFVAVYRGDRSKFDIQILAI